MTSGAQNQNTKRRNLSTGLSYRLMSRKVHGAGAAELCESRALRAASGRGGGNPSLDVPHTARDRECVSLADLRDAYLWVVMSDSSKTTSPQQWSVNTTLTYSPKKIRPVGFSDQIFDHYHNSGFFAWIKKPTRTPGS